MTVTGRPIKFPPRRTGRRDAINRHDTFIRHFIMVLLAAALVCGGFSGCAETGKQEASSSSPAKTDAASSSVSVTKAEDGASDSLPEPVKASEKILKGVTKSMESCAVSDASGLYDLTSVISTDRASLMCYGMYDEENVLLVYLSESRQIYRAVLLDLADRTMTQAAAWKNAAPKKQDYNYVKLLSCSPLVVFDSVGNIIYRPDIHMGKPYALSESDGIFSDNTSVKNDGNAFALSSDEANVSVQCLDGSVYLSDPDGFLRRLESGNSSEDVFTLPYTYSYFTPVHMNDTGRLTFLTYPASDSDNAVFMAVDPKSGGYRCYTCDTQSFYDTEDDGYLFSTYYDSYPILTVIRPEEKRQVPFRLPSSVADKLAIQPDAEGNYPSDGGDVPILSVCTLPVEGDLCLFSLDDSYGNGVSDLYLMDLTQASWQSFSPPEKKEYTLTRTDYGDLTDKADDLEKEYGLKIEMGANIPTSFDDYDTVQVTDTSRMSGALSAISDALAIYPEGYFEDVSDGYYRDIVIYLTGTLTPHDDTANIQDAGGFTTQSGGLAKVAFNIDYDLDRGTIIHELTHVLDYRLEGKDEMDDDGWNELNPDGFNYYYSYIDSDGNSYEYTGDTAYTPLAETDPERIYFVDTYSKTYPMEDRARLMEYLLRDPENVETYFGGEPIQKKLTWYFRAIRDAIGTDSWPQETAWEKALKKAAG